MKKFYFFLVAMLLGVITSSAADPGKTYVINGIAENGSWAGWSKAACAAQGYVFTETSSGIYELTVDMYGKSFVICALNSSGTNGDWNTKVQITGSVKADQEYSFTQRDGNNISLAENIEGCHIILNTNTNKVKFEGKSVANSFDVVYMVGDFGSGWNTTVTDYPLNPVAGKANTYEGTYTVDGASGGYFYTVPKCGTSILQLTSGDVEITSANSGQTFSLASGSGSFKCAPGTYKFTVVADQAANTGTITITMTDAPAPEENTIYWDNSTAAWETVYAYAVNDKNEAYEEKPGAELSDLGNGLWSATIPATYTKVTFSNGEGAEYGAYTIQNEYIYGPNQSGKPYEEPVDYSSWYVNVPGTFNSWGDNGLSPVNGISTHENLNIGNGEFEIKIWDGEAHYFGTATPIVVGEWIKIYKDGGHMTIAGATANEAFNVEYNCATNEIRVTKAGAIDYTGWYLNICGDFNEWSTMSGTELNAEGVAVNTCTNVNTSFKVVIWDGKANNYYSNGQEIAAGTWVKIPGDVTDNMTLPANLQSGKVTFTWNNETKELKVEGDSSSVDAIEIEENVAPVYYNLQGVRVDAPANGLYIVVRGDKVAKEYVK